jgi:hypothetical protein
VPATLCHLPDGPGLGAHASAFPSLRVEENLSSQRAAKLDSRQGMFSPFSKFARNTEETCSVVGNNKWLPSQEPC